MVMKLAKFGKRSAVHTQMRLPKSVKSATRSVNVSPIKYLSNRCSDTISLHSQSGSTLRTQQALGLDVAVSGSPYLLGQT
jgi:hypothetical protein